MGSLLIPPRATLAEIIFATATWAAPSRARFPAANLKIQLRGWLKTGYYADIAIFDPDKVQDHATFAEPQQYATGMVHVFVNGEQVLKDGDHTDALPGQVVRGPGYRR